MLNLLDLRNNQLDAPHEAFGVMVMEDVHIHTLVAASKERLAVLISLDTASDRCKHESSRIDGLEVASWHLQNYRVDSWHDGHELRTTLDTSAALIRLGFISRHFEFCESLASHFHRQARALTV